MLTKRLVNFPLGLFLVFLSCDGLLIWSAGMNSIFDQIFAVFPVVATALAMLAWAAFSLIDGIYQNLKHWRPEVSTAVYLNATKKLADLMNGVLRSSELIILLFLIEQAARVALLYSVAHPVAEPSALVPVVGLSMAITVFALSVWMSRLQVKCIVAAVELRNFIGDYVK